MKNVLNLVRQLIKMEEECLLREIEITKHKIVALPSIKRQLKQLRKWKKRASTLRQADLIFIIILRPTLDDSHRQKGQDVFIRKRGKLKDVVEEAHTLFNTSNSKSCKIYIPYSSCYVVLRGGMRFEVPQEVWQPFLTS